MVNLVVNFRRSVIIAELLRPEVARPGHFVSNFCVFWEKRPLAVKFFKILFRKFPQPHRSTLLCSNVVKFVRREIGEIVCNLPQKITKFRLPLRLSLLRESLPKSARASTMCSQCSRFHPNPFTFGGVIAERVNTVFAP